MNNTYFTKHFFIKYFLDLISAVEILLDDFENYGEVLQSNENGEYDQDCAISELQKAYRELAQYCNRNKNKQITITLKEI